MNHLRVKSVTSKWLLGYKWTARTIPIEKQPRTAAGLSGPDLWARCGTEQRWSFPGADALDPKRITARTLRNLLTVWQKLQSRMPWRAVRPFRKSSSRVSNQRVALIRLDFSFPRHLHHFQLMFVRCPVLSGQIALIRQ
jgi:hypothetical protein